MKANIRRGIFRNDNMSKLRFFKRTSQLNPYPKHVISFVMFKAFYETKMKAFVKRKEDRIRYNIFFPNV